MSTAAMTAQEAAILLVNLDVETVVAQAIATVVNRLAELESETPAIGLVALRKLIQQVAADDQGDPDAPTYDLDCDTCDRIAAAVVAYAGTGKVTTVWAITWPGDVVVEEHSDRESAERAARAAGLDAYVVSAESRRGPWMRMTS